MRTKIHQIIPAMLLTILMLVILEIISTSLVPMLGIVKYRLQFNILIVLFLGLKLETPVLALLVLAVQYTHSFFSIEGWAVGTIAGIIVCITISYLRDMIHLSSKIATIVVTQIFQTLWFVIIASMIYFKTSNIDYVVDKFWRFLPESLIVSAIAPFFFVALDFIWIGKDKGLMGEDN